jgi:selenium metabolism protein YedF
MKNIVDARGLMCPKPLIMTKKALTEAADNTITVMVDNTTAVNNIKAFALSEGLDVAVTPQDADYELVVSKIADNVATDIDKQISEGIEDMVQNKSGAVVLINDDQFGGGDDEFGEILMKNFIFALTEVNPKPATIIFVNAGVYFACEGSAVLESLQILEQAGVEIISCGACLDFYNLKDSLVVGQVSNMYTIAEKLLRASHVVKP